MQYLSNQNSNLSPHQELLKAIVAAGILANPNVNPKSWGMIDGDFAKESVEGAYHAIFGDKVGEINNETDKRIENLFKLLPWNAQMQDEFFDRMTGKTTRDNLNKFQISECLEYLEAYIEVSNLIKEMAWSSKQERKYFECHHTGKVRTDLDTEQLRDFLEYLQLFQEIDLKVDDFSLSIDELSKKLQKSYGVKTRVELNLEKLQDFLHWIESIAIPY